MPLPRFPLTFLLVAALIVGCASLPAAAAAAAGAQGLTTGFTDTGPFSSKSAQDSTLAFSRARQAGARVIRIYVSWAGTAPRELPGAWDPTNPDDRHYGWYADDEVRRAVAAGMTPVLSVLDAPTWSGRGGGTGAPDPRLYGQFMLAAARHYSGATPGVPSVRYWQVWNEPNASFFFAPQREGGNNVSPGLYRNLVNSTAAAVRSVSDSNRVVAGGAYPFDINNAAGTQAIGARRFLREVLSARTDFDIWSTHPYTQGNAFHKALNPDGASLGDLSDVRVILDGAARDGKIGSRGPVQFWVTEFQWDSSPPDPKGVPLRLLTRWTAEALFQAWRSGVSTFVWFQLEDDPPGPNSFQGGFYSSCTQGFTCAQPKPTLAAFRFPFVAYRQPGKRRKGSRRKLPGPVLVWGRTPTGAPGTVAIEQKSGRRWLKLIKLKADTNGIFAKKVKTSGKGALRARRSGGDVAVPFSLTVPPDRPLANPFGA